MGTILGYDAIGANVNRLPPGAQVAGYDTGTGVVPWTAAQFVAHPGAVHIDQDPAASDPLADVLDVENGAATFADCPGWSKRAWADYHAVLRQGQRTPTIYASASNLTNVANALVNGGVTSGVNLWLADWSLSVAQAIDLIDNAGGPFPIVAVQYSNGAVYDFDVFGTAWLASMAGVHVLNPVSGLKVTRRGYTSIELAWNAPKGAVGYTVKTYWRGGLIEEQNVVTPSVRVRNLSPLHRTYEFRVRAHPSGSMGNDATINATTR